MGEALQAAMTLRDQELDPAKLGSTAWAAVQAYVFPALPSRHFQLFLTVCWPGAKQAAKTVTAHSMLVKRPFKFCEGSSKNAVGKKHKQ